MSRKIQGTLLTLMLISICAGCSRTPSATTSSLVHYDKSGNYWGVALPENTSADQIVSNFLGAVSFLKGVPVPPVSERPVSVDPRDRVVGSIPITLLKVTRYSITNVLAGWCEGGHRMMVIDVDTDIGPKQVTCSYGHSGRKPIVWECDIHDKMAPEFTPSGKKDEEP